jgi:hypothetical protein
MKLRLKLMIEFVERNNEAEKRTGTEYLNLHNHVHFDFSRKEQGWKD